MPRAQAQMCHTHRKPELPVVQRSRHLLRAKDCAQAGAPTAARSLVPEPVGGPECPPRDVLATGDGMPYGGDRLSRGTLRCVGVSWPPGLCCRPTWVCDFGPGSVACRDPGGLLVSGVVDAAHALHLHAPLRARPPACPAGKAPSSLGGDVRSKRAAGRGGAAIACATRIRTRDTECLRTHLVAGPLLNDSEPTGREPRRQRRPGSHHALVTVVARSQWGSCMTGLMHVLVISETGQGERSMVPSSTSALASTHATGVVNPSGRMRRTHTFGWRAAAAVALRAHRTHDGMARCEAGDDSSQVHALLESASAYADDSRARTRARIHTHTHARTRTHTRTHARTHAHTHTHSHTHTHARTLGEYKQYNERTVNCLT